MPNPNETFWKDVKCKSADELSMAECHRFLLAFCTIILVRDGHSVVIDGQNSMVRDGDFPAKDGTSYGCISRDIPPLTWATQKVF